MRVESPRWVPWLPLYRAWGQGVYKEEGSPDRRVVSLREVLANLACKLRRLVGYPVGPVSTVGQLELGDELPEGKLQEPFYGVRMSE